MWRHQDRALVLLMLFLMSMTPVLSSSPLQVQGEQKAWEHGEQDWDLPQLNRLFFSGNEAQSTNLSLEHPFDSDPDGRRQVDGGAGQQVIFDNIVSPPLLESVDAIVNISAFIHATAGEVPLVNCAFTGRATQMFIDIRAGGQSIYNSQSEPIIIRESSMSMAHNFTFDRTQVPLNLSAGDIFEVSLSVNHDCAVPIDVWWAGISHDGGLIIEGDLIKPDVRVLHDDLGFAHVDLVPMGPWGIEAFRSVVMEVWGGLDEDDSRPVDRESIIQITSEPQVIRTVEEGRTAWTYLTPQLNEGHTILQFCMKTNDGYYTSRVGECHFRGWIHVVDYGVEDEGYTPVFWLAPFSIVALLGWIGFSLKQGVLLPLPLIAVMLVMALLFIPLTLQMPQLADDDTRVATGWPAPQFVLNTAGNNSTAMGLDSLLEDMEATLVAVSIAGSPVQEQHLSLLDMVSTGLEDRVSVSMLITGEEVQPYELEELQQKVDGRWAVMIDEHDGSVANTLPTGNADGVVLIDSSGHVAWWSAGTSTLEEVETATDAMSTGSDNGPMDIISLVWLAFFPLILISLPTKRWEKPEMPIPPGSNWGGTILTAGAGFLLIGLPLTIMGMTPLSGEAWYLVQLGLTGVLVYHSISMMIWKAPLETRIISGSIYSRLPEPYRLFKTKEEFMLEFMLGTWVAWLSWIASPMLIQQGLSVPMINGFGGIMMGIILMIGCTLAAGIVILVARIISGSAGNLSVMLGRYGRDDLLRVFGLFMLPIALWLGFAAFLDAQSMGFFS